MGTVTVGAEVGLCDGRVAVECEGHALCARVAEAALPQLQHPQARRALEQLGKPNAHTFMRGGVRGVNGRVISTMG